MLLGVLAVYLCCLQVIGGPSAEVQAPQKKMVKALYDYKGKTARELNINKGNILVLLSSSNRVNKIILICSQQSFIRSFVHSFIHSFTHSFLLFFAHSFIYPFIHSFIQSFVRSFISSFICSFIHSFTHSFLTLLFFS